MCRTYQTPEMSAQINVLEWTSAQSACLIFIQYVLFMSLGWSLSASMD